MTLSKVRTKEQSESGIIFNIPTTELVNENVPKKSDPVFYNKKQALNRDISVAVLKGWSEIYDVEFSNIAEPFSGTGIRALRYALQVPSIKSIYVNDIAPKSINITKKNFKNYNDTLKNKVKISYHNTDAKLFFLRLRQEEIFLNFIDIDPYGSPQQFMRSALLTLEKSGVIAVTATDMPVITGLYPSKAYRLYNIPFNVRNRSYCHEIGLRMFIAYLQREGLFYKQKLIPILSYYADHYVRVFMVNKIGGSIEDIIYSHGYVLDCPKCNKRTFYDWERKDKESAVYCDNCRNPVVPIGPIYIEKLHDTNLINYLCNNLDAFIKNGMIDRINRFKKIVPLFKEDLVVNIPWFYSMGNLGKLMKKSLVSPKQMIVILKKMGYNASLTHFSGQGVKTDYTLELDDGSKFVQDI
jgi:tRNA (guanine26-N2/guanine27-N2)-dimethyltransferase